MPPEFPFTLILRRHEDGKLTALYVLGEQLSDDDESFVSNTVAENFRRCPQEPGIYRVQGVFVPDTFDSDGYVAEADDAEYVRVKTPEKSWAVADLQKRRAKLFAQRLGKRAESYRSSAEYACTGKGDPGGWFVSLNTCIAVFRYDGSCGLSLDDPDESFEFLAWEEIQGYARAMEAVMNLDGDRMMAELKATLDRIREVPV